MSTVATEPDLPAQAPPPEHFIQAVTELGQQRPVVTTEAIYNLQGIKVLDKGVKVDERLYERLIQHRLRTPIESCVASDPAVSGKVLREAAQAVMEQHGFFARMGEVPRTRELLLDAIEAIPLPREVAFHLTLAKTIRPSVFEHGVQSALMAAWLTQGPVASRFDMGMVAAAGLLHDLGMLHIDPIMLQPEHEITGEHRKHLYAHPITTSMLVQKHHVYPKDVVTAILEHHERLDGSGYPRGLVGEAISPWGRILSVCEVATAMFGGGRDHPELRISLLLRLNKGRYDPELVQAVESLLKPVVDAEAARLSKLADPVLPLRSLGDLVAQWPQVMAAVVQTAPQLSARDREMLQTMVQQLQSLARMMAAAGVDAAQLDWLGDPDAMDDALRAELTLIAREAAWQLRTTAHQIRRRWSAGVAYPPPLAQWFDQVEATAGALLVRHPDAPGSATAAQIGKK